MKTYISPIFLICGWLILCSGTVYLFINYTKVHRKEYEEWEEYIPAGSGTFPTTDSLLTSP
jgi:hypothetical protein